MITAAADTVLQDGRDVCIIRASQLEPGDVIVRHESIDLPITSVRHHKQLDQVVWVVAGYACTAGTGARTLVAHSFVSILPRTSEEAH